MSADGFGLASAAADAYNLEADSAHRAGHALPLLLNPVCICVIRVICGEVLPGREGCDDFCRTVDRRGEESTVRIQTQLAVGRTPQGFSETISSCSMASSRSPVQV